MALNPAKFGEYMRIIGVLKQVKRAGWLRCDIAKPESVADHMYRMAMMAFAIPPDSGLDRDKCIKIALVHDMAESIVGDLTPYDKVDKSEKSRQENEATVHITNLIGGESGKEMYNLWLEYEHQTSPEAKFVKDIDKLEMIYQASEYEEQTGRTGELQEFFNYTNEKVPKCSYDFTQSWKDELVEKRKETIKGPDKKETTSAPISLQESAKSNDAFL